MTIMWLALVVSWATNIWLILELFRLREKYIQIKEDCDDIIKQTTEAIKISQQLTTTHKKGITHGTND